MHRFYRRVFWWAIVPALVLLATLTVASAILLRPARLKAMVTAAVSEKLNLDASLDEVSVSFLPRPHMSGAGLTLRLPNRPELPPFVTIATFKMNIGLFSAMRKHVDTVEVTGLAIAVPPGDARNDLPSGDDVSGDGGGMSDVIVNHLVSKDAMLTFVRRDPNKRPLTFVIHDLDMENLGFSRKIPFTATLTNPVPTGLVRAAGTIGPWVKTEATRTPVSGSYTFTDADLQTINGIGGILQSTGKFAGQLTDIGVTGEARVPDFNLELGGKPVALTATFEALVDATDGTTTLKHVEAKMGQTPMIVTGAIVNLEGPGNHKIDLDVDIKEGRIEDLVALAIDAPRPIMKGDVTLRAKFSLPPGKQSVRERLRLAGHFGLSDTEFTEAQVQGKLQELSRRSQGKDEDDPVDRALTRLRGDFTIGNGVLTLPNLNFRVPGAEIAMAGTYALAAGALDFHGTLRMKASVSQAVGGFKSIFIKPFDGLFRKNGTGAVVPIRIGGTRQSPQFGLEWKRVGKDDKPRPPLQAKSDVKPEAGKSLTKPGEKIPVKPGTPKAANQSANAPATKAQPR